MVCCAFGCNDKAVAIRGLSDGSRLAIYCTKPCPASALPLFVLRELSAITVYAIDIDIAMHTFCFMGSLILAINTININTAVSVSYLLYPFRHFPFCSVFFFFFCHFCLVFVFVLSLELLRCSSDVFVSSRPRTTQPRTQYIPG